MTDVRIPKDGRKQCVMGHIDLERATKTLKNYLQQNNNKAFGMSQFFFQIRLR
jgi:hypothetical protein